MTGGGLLDLASVDVGAEPLDIEAALFRAIDLMFPPAPSPLDVTPGELLEAIGFELPAGAR